MYKAAILFNIPELELLPKIKPEDISNLDFTPVFDIDNYSPVTEFKKIEEILRRKGFSTLTLNVKDDLAFLLAFLKNEKPDVIFNFIEYFNEEITQEKNIAGLFELLGIPFTGASSISLANCQNKVITKNILIANGINTPEYCVIEKPDNPLTDKIRFPIILKPINEDGSAGIDTDSVVYNKVEYEIKFSDLIRYCKPPFLAEQFIEGREFNVAILGNEKPEVLPISEIDFSEMPYYLENIVSYQAKWEPLNEAYHKTIPVCPADLSKKIEDRIKEIALKCYEVMDLRDYARIDIRMTPEKELFVLEINPNPDITEGVGFMRSAEAAGYSYSDILELLIRYALKRRKVE